MTTKPYYPEDSEVREKYRHICPHCKTSEYLVQYDRERRRQRGVYVREVWCQNCGWKYVRENVGLW